MKPLFRYFLILALGWQSCAPSYYQAGQMAYTRYDIKPGKKTAAYSS
ncbi:hypothetical protein [Phnomibacter ginsenosidimutans]|uniref:Uncharacterized protein n=1 Tax=Phnomibacter ginsenosidimutans TaxID=2676868 RepID=A0A6I6GVV8_9BACT|nr:hypothetical protein [Phnomibacter ginsenosidimutans]QGW29259.1 hypothetical protein GLV81_15090 [Phnomibacter ginsenosidimutans]